MGGGELQRFLKMGGGGGGVLEPGFEFPEHRVEKIISVEALAIRDRLYGGLSRCWTVHIGDSYGAVQGDDGRLIDFGKAIVHREDLGPIGGGVVWRGAMACCDAGLEMISAQLFSRGGIGKVPQTADNSLLVPLGTVLLFEPQNVAG